MEAPKPITLDYTLQLAGPSPSHPECWDIDLWLPLPGQADPLPPALLRLGRAAPGGGPGALAQGQGDKQLEALDVQAADLCRRLLETRRRRDFFAAFSEDPAAFVRSVVASSARDLRVARSAAGASFHFEAVERSDFFRAKWVEDAVLRYMHRRLAGGGA